MKLGTQTQSTSTSTPTVYRIHFSIPRTRRWRLERRGGNLSIPSQSTHPISLLNDTPLIRSPKDKEMALGRWRKRESSSRRRHRHHECVVALLAAIYCFCYTGLADASLRGNGDVGASGEVVLRTCQQAAAWTESVSNTNIIGVTGDTTKGEPLPMYFRFAFEAGETLDCLEGVSECERVTERASNRESVARYCLPRCTCMPTCLLYFFCVLGGAL